MIFAFKNPYHAERFDLLDVELGVADEAGAAVGVVGPAALGAVDLPLLLLGQGQHRGLVGLGQIEFILE